MTRSTTSYAVSADAARTLTIALVFTLFTAVAFGFYLFALLVSSMRQDLGFDYTLIGLITGGAQLAYLVGALLCPRLSERFGRGRTSLGAVLIAGGALMLISQLGNILSIAIVLVAMGALAAMVAIPSVGIITRSVPYAYRSQVNGLVSSGTAYGQLINGLLVAWVLPGHGWPLIWLIVGIITLGIVLLGWLGLRLHAAWVLQRPELASVNVAAAANDSPLFTGQNMLVWTLLALTGMACGPWQNYLSSFLSDERGQALAVISGLWSVIGAIGLFSGFAAGMAADRLGVRLSLAFAYAMLAGSALLVAFAVTSSLLNMAAICFGLSFYAVYGLIPAYISKTVSPQQGIRIFAIANVCLGLGTLSGNFIGGYMPAWSGSLKGVYLGAAALCVLGLLLSLCLDDERRMRGATQG